jgi:leucyl-tRNA synthetase
VAPHITEELWRTLGHDENLIEAAWPSFQEEALAVDKRLVVVQVNGKVRGRIEVPVSYGEKEIEAAALGDEKVRRFIREKPIKKVIIVQNKLVNVVV